MISYNCLTASAVKQFRFRLTKTQLAVPSTGTTFLSRTVDCPDWCLPPDGNLFRFRSASSGKLAFFTNIPEAE